MFGSMTQYGEFKDGLVTDELKSAARVQKKKAIFEINLKRN